MQSRLSARRADAPLRPLFWGLMAVLTVAQVAAIYMVCRDQVHKAQAREAGLHKQQLALTDCLHNTANSTIGSCFSQVRNNYDDGGSVVSGGISTSPARATLIESRTLTPAHFSFR